MTMSAAAKTEMLPEQALLAKMLANKTACAAALAQCRRGLFQDSFHRRIFDAAGELVAAGEAVTPLKLRVKLANDPAWDEFAADYLETLKMSAPPGTDIAALLSTMRRDLADAAPSDRRTFLVRSMNTLRDTASHDYLIKGLFAPAEMSVLYGEPGSGKSFLASWLAYNLSLGRNVFDRRVHRTPVVYVALEGQVGFERRLHALRATYSPSDKFFWITQSADLHGGVGDTQGLVDAVLKAEAGLLVIDTLARAMGAGSENEGRDMGLLIESLDFIRRETGAHVCVVHHSGKDSARGMRGHSSLLGASDMALEVKRDGDIRSVRVVKSKDGRDGDEHGFALDVVDLGTDADGDQITTCLIRETGAVQPAARVALTTRERGWLNDLTALFAEPDMAIVASPREEMAPIQILTREQVRDGLKRKGRFDLNPHGGLTDGDRQKLRAALVDLKDKGKIGMTDKHVWLMRGRE